MPYWIGVASHDHVRRGIAGSFCQLCHGKAQPLRRMRAGDWMLYYSPREAFGEDTLCQAFTAIGRIRDDVTYPFEISPDFIPWRRNIDFLPCRHAAIRPLLDELSFIADKHHWGQAFRYRHLEIPRADFERIVRCMVDYVPT